MKNDEKILVFDVCVLGGGMIGAAVALGLARQGKRVAIVEKIQPQPFEAGQDPDIRVSAISQASVQFLGSLGAWQPIALKRVHPYQRLAVWEDAGNRTEFDAQEAGQPHLGYFVENRILQLGLYEALHHCQTVSWFVGRTPRSLDVNTGTVTLDDGQCIEAEVLIGADGGQSKSRELTGIGTRGWQYAQHALGVLIKAPDADKSLTWQQFRPAGPLAFLPMFGQFASLIWYDEAAVIGKLKTQNPAQLHLLIAQHFPDLMGKFEVLESAAFPLTRMHANQYGKGRLLLVGDAVHTINPLAGQGVNLGFKDVARLLPLLERFFEDNISLAVLQSRYEKQRRPANLAMMSIMDALYHAFSNDIPPIKHMRNLGLRLAHHSGPIKRKVMEYAMGLA